MATEPSRIPLVIPMGDVQPGDVLWNGDSQGVVRWIGGCNAGKVKALFVGGGWSAELFPEQLVAVLREGEEQ